MFYLNLHNAFLFPWLTAGVSQVSLSENVDLNSKNWCDAYNPTEDVKRTTSDTLVTVVPDAER